MQLSVPFIPDETYIDFLNDRSQNLASVYFPLYEGPVLDARMRFDAMPLSKLRKGLQKLKCDKKYCILNTRFVHPKLYEDSHFLTLLANNLEKLAVQNHLTGIVFSDSYLVNALSAVGSEGLSGLEAVPGVNCMIDSFSKLVSFFDLIDQSEFEQPGKVILDRSLNRDNDTLKQVRQSVKAHYPGIKIELLANEGCIYHCPFKLTHDAHISFSNTGAGKDRTHRINTRIGCRRYFYASPERFLKSPFIRPDDLRFYTGLADAVKICGRTLGVKFLMRTIDAYQGDSYDGNLFELMDATHWLSDFYHLDNKKLGHGFFNLISGCTKTCKTCRICHTLFKNTTIQKPVTIKPYKEYL